MTALDTFTRIISNDNLVYSDLKYCLVDKNKIPYTIYNQIAKPNHLADFVSLNNFYDIDLNILNNYAGIGISVNASEIQAIDVDKCFKIQFDINSADDRAIDIINMFKDFAYIEFSFSGTGLRVLLKQVIIDNYQTKFFIKNSRDNIEFYQYTDSFRYVTITGKTIVNNKIHSNISFSNSLMIFLNKYMKRTDKIKLISKVNSVYSDEQLLSKLKYNYFCNNTFQDVWFSQAPGSGKDESERDFYLLSYIYENITTEKEQLKWLFEQSPFYKSKDFKHQQKWLNQNYRYFEYLYKRISS